MREIRWRLDHRPVVMVAWLAAIAALAAMVACALGDPFARLGVHSVQAGREHLFLSTLMLGLTCLVTFARWKPSVGKGARAFMAALGVICSAAALVFGYGGLAMVLSGFALLDLLGYLRSPRE
ncbi:hypothetical protein ARC20_05610 [Stenotrophomonas panacihumi]|uniref:Uncharacterized protein n=1 Tax=Stenotrophomonas panacihumi TaxID=676599 RepID=A0A0R0AM48_9GAMM|nr:hypothetical protein [Stenotrophomonas panacihumi]KRG46331.1 hypothetical protein ARC20_05610 [Stenotrophomonas panacihumi]PTN54712.1 hypothetical protein C9J98_08410 [Stenotrophomonas panacihumi]